MVYLNKLKKTKKNNNSYKLNFLKKGKAVTIGSYDQLNNKLVIDILTLSFIIGRGEKFSLNFYKIFKRITGVVTKNKIVTVKY